MATGLAFAVSQLVLPATDGVSEETVNVLVPPRRTSSIFRSVLMQVPQFVVLPIFGIWNPTFGEVVQGN